MENLHKRGESTGRQATRFRHNNNVGVMRGKKKVNVLFGVHRLLSVCCKEGEGGDVAMQRFHEMVPRKAKEEKPKGEGRTAPKAGKRMWGKTKGRQREGKKRRKREGESMFVARV